MSSFLFFFFWNTKWSIKCLELGWVVAEEDCSIDISLSLHSGEQSVILLEAFRTCDFLLPKLVESPIRPANCLSGLLPTIIGITITSAQLECSCRSGMSYSISLLKISHYATWNILRLWEQSQWATACMKKKITALIDKK